jgi:hypothetical protein
MCSLIIVDFDKFIIRFMVILADCPTVLASQLDILPGTCSCTPGAASVCVTIDTNVTMTFTQVYHVTGIELDFGVDVTGSEIHVT